MKYADAKHMRATNEADKNTMKANEANIRAANAESGLEGAEHASHDGSLQTGAPPAFVLASASAETAAPASSDSKPQVTSEKDNALGSGDTEGKAQSNVDKVPVEEDPTSPQRNEDDKAERALASPVAAPQHDPRIVTEEMLAQVVQVGFDEDDEWKEQQRLQQQTAEQEAERDRATKARKARRRARRKRAKKRRRAARKSRLARDVGVDEEWEAVIRKKLMAKRQKHKAHKVAWCSPFAFRQESNVFGRTDSLAETPNWHWTPGGRYARAARSNLHRTRLDSCSMGAASSTILTSCSGAPENHQDRRTNRRQH